MESWISLEINQLPGLYLNLEQRVQKFSLIQQDYKMSIIALITYINSCFKKNLKKTKNLFLVFNFFHKFWILNEFKEVNSQVYLFDKKSSHSFFINLLSLTSIYTYKLLPSKLILEDPYRTSLQLKYSRTLTKSSQLIRMEVPFR
jgi:hypothetical protein